ncbi:MAG: hypothetical protein NTZ05_08890 [Chloroflexi bacterium]|nr:hypothetical protein [Chloroflexota bacterium]
MKFREQIAKHKGLLWTLVIGAGLAYMFMQGGSSNNTLPLPGMTANRSQTTGPAAPTEPEFDFDTPPTEEAPVVEVNGQMIKTAGALVLLNPGSASAGAAVSISGTGFEPGMRVNMLLKRGDQDKGTELPYAVTDKNGNLAGAAFQIPDDWIGGKYQVIAKSVDGKHEARASGAVTPKIPEVKMAEQVGKPGDMLGFSAKSFKGGEQVQIFLDSLATDPVGVFKVGPGGNVDQGTIQVPFGAAGQHSVIFYGEKGQAPVAIPFTLLQLYPSGGVSAYATRADTAILLSGNGFGPREQVRIHLNSTETPPKLQECGALRHPVSVGRQAKPDLSGRWLTGHNGAGD